MLDVKLIRNRQPRKRTAFEMMKLFSFQNDDNSKIHMGATTHSQQCTDLTNKMGPVPNGKRVRVWSLLYNYYEVLFEICLFKICYFTLFYTLNVRM